MPPPRARARARFRASPMATTPFTTMPSTTPPRHADPTARLPPLPPTEGPAAVGRGGRGCRAAAAAPPPAAVAASRGRQGGVPPRRAPSRQTVGRRTSPRGGRRWLPAARLRPPLPPRRPSGHGARDSGGRQPRGCSPGAARFALPSWRRGRLPPRSVRPPVLPPPEPRLPPAGVAAQPVRARRRQCRAGHQRRERRDRARWTPAPCCDGAAETDGHDGQELHGAR